MGFCRCWRRATTNKSAANGCLLLRGELAALADKGLAAAHDAFPRIPAQPAKNGALQEAGAVYAAKAGGTAPEAYFLSHPDADPSCPKGLDRTLRVYHPEARADGSRGVATGRGASLHRVSAG